MLQIKTILLTTAQKILAPLVRILLRHGISHAEFAELARKVYVNEATNHFHIPGRKQSVSRVAVLTGLSRKEVLRLQQTTESAPLMEKAPLNRATRVITGWTTDAEFIDAKGQPLPLPSSGAGASFSTLIKRYSGDITAGAILDELIRVGAIEPRDEYYYLRAPAYIPREDEVEKIKLLGICGRDFLNTVEHNVSNTDETPYYQRELIYHDLPKEVVSEFQKLSEQKANALISELHHWLANKKLQIRTQTFQAERIRTGLGVYFFKDFNVEEDFNEK